MCTLKFFLTLGCYTISLSWFWRLVDQLVAVCTATFYRAGGSDANMAVSNSPKDVHSVPPTMPLVLHYATTDGTQCTFQSSISLTLFPYNDAIPHCWLLILSSRPQALCHHNNNRCCKSQASQHVYFTTYVLLARHHLLCWTALSADSTL